MHTLDITQKGVHIEIPSEWDDCSPEQVHFILKNAFLVMDGSLSIADFRIKVFAHLTGLKIGLKDRIYQRLGLNKLINEKIFLFSQELCDWIFSKNEDDNYELNFNSVLNYFPVLEGKFYGLDHLLADISLSEFKSALSLINQYFDSKTNEEDSETYLNYFIATLYRPKNSQGVKLPLSEYILEPDNFKKIAIWKKQIIAIWFSYCVKCLQEEDVVIDGMDVNFSVLFPKPNGARNNRQKVNLGWNGVILDIAESGVFGDAEHTGKTLLYDVLIYLLKKHQDQPIQK